MPGIKLSILNALTAIILLMWTSLLHAENSKGWELFVKGDSLLNAQQNELARDYYTRAEAQGLQYNDHFVAALSVYKTALSWLIDDETYLSLAGFTKLQLYLEPLNKRDSAIYFLAFLEEIVITKEAIFRTDYNPELIEKLILELDDEYQQRFWFLMAGIELLQLNNKQAIIYFQEASKFSGGFLYTTENAWYQMGNTFASIFENHRAIECFDYLLSQSLKYVYKYDVYYYLAVAYEGLESKEDVEVALKYFEGILKEVDVPVYQYISLIGLGNCYELLGQLSRVKQFYQKAYNIAVENEMDPLKQSSVLQSLGFYYNQIKDYQQAEEYYFKSYQIIRENKIPLLYRVAVVDMLSSAYRRNGKLHQAANISNTLLQDMKKNPDSYRNPNLKKLLINIRYDLALAYINLWEEDKQNVEYLLKADTVVKEVIHESKQLVVSLYSDKSKLSIQERFKYYIEAAFFINYHLYERNPDQELLDYFIEISELNQAALFQEKQEKNAAIQLADIPSSLLEMEGKVKKQISLCNYYINSNDKEIDPDLIRKLKSERVKGQNVLDSIYRVYNNKYKVNDKKYKGRKLISTKKIQGRMSDDEVILNYNLAEGFVYVMLIEKESAYIYRDSFPESLIEEVYSLRDKLTSYSDFSEMHTNETVKSFAGVSGKLYGRLIAPYKEYIENKRLIIIPDKELNLFPFDVLVEDLQYNETNLSWSELPYLLYSNPVTTIYSHRQFLREAEKLNRFSQLRGFAPGYDNELYADLLLDKLPGAEDEVLTARKYFRGEVYTGNKATKAKFREEADKADIVHLALHTRLSDIDPAFSQLLFTKTASDSLGAFFIFDLQDMYLKAKFVVLSGCNTGAGRLRRGEGLMNLARGFFFRGATNLIVTQWPVSDRSSAQIMKNFYATMVKGNTADVALQEAKISFLRKADPLKHHPYYWSGFSSLGNPVEYKSVITIWWSLLSLPILLFIGLVAKKRNWF
jgi:CHAT domain-containing protein/tetratricopeptide (TPR) repeat protein